jgi:hypothetical protein
MTVRGTCPHVSAEREGDYYQYFIGQGVDSWFLCGRCSEEIGAGTQVHILAINEAEARRIRADAFCNGIMGAPAITERPGRPLAPLVDTTIIGPQVIAFAAMPDRGLLAYNECQDLEILDDATNPATRRVIANLKIEIEKSEPNSWRPIALRLIVDPTGRFAALVHDYGRTGIVIDLGSGDVTMTLDGGDYHSNVVPFSACFVLHRGAPVLIHRTAWNRLDASDPKTGRQMTARAETSYQHGEERPEHYRDYFHGALLPSPSGSIILDDGWVWQPFGDLTIFDSQVWLERNPWETEDGMSLKTLLMREEWDAGVAWVTDDLVAVGHQFPADHQGDGLGFLVCKSTRELTPIAGPSGRFFSDRSRLFTATPAGLSVWNLEDGTRAGFIPGFNPTVQHRSRRSLMEVHGDRLRAWSYASEG